MWRWIRWGCEIRFDGDHLWGQSEGGLSCLLDQNGLEPSSTWFGLVAPSWKTISPLAGFFYSFAMCGLVMIALSIPDGCLFVAQQQPIDRPNKLVVGFHGQQHRQNTLPHNSERTSTKEAFEATWREWKAYLTDSRKIFCYRFLSSLETRHSRKNLQQGQRQTLCEKTELTPWRTMNTPGQDDRNSKGKTIGQGQFNFLLVIFRFSSGGRTFKEHYVSQ